MNIKQFEIKYVGAAENLMRENYEEMRTKMAFLPDLDELPSLNYFAEHGVGVVALDANDNLLGYLCCYAPIENFWGFVKGAFSPLHGHGAVRENRKYIYNRLYQAFSEMLVKDEILSHGITVYRGDEVAVLGFFENGFGNACVDGILRNFDLGVKAVEDVEFFELERERFGDVLGMQNALIRHLGKAPTFLSYREMNFEEFEERLKEDQRYFAVKKDDEMIGYARVQKDGENFISSSDGMMNISGAYLKEEYRGQGIYPALIQYVLNVLKKEGAERVGVDYESFNLTANSFWPKYFEPYTWSMVRRVDDRALEVI